MTLRVTVEIVPFGDESRTRTIAVFNISNIANLGDGVCMYGVEKDKYKTQQYDHTVSHRREDGYGDLVAQVLKGHK